MFDEPFARGRSLVHGLDPRMRLAMAALFSICVALLKDPIAAGSALIPAVAVLSLSAPPLQMLCKRVALVNVFILFLWLTVPLTMPGTPLATLGPLTASREGAELVLLATLKSNAILLTFLALVTTMDSPTMGHALDRLGVPSKLVFLFLFTYRYLHVIADEWQRLVTAARLRGFTPRTGMHTYRTIGNLLAMVLVNSFDRSSRVYQAMVLRGFQGRFVSVVRFRARPRDAIFAFLWMAATVGIVLMDFFPEIRLV
ncbi:cobalt/nickel transport system permease protein [Desulfomicrobium apsheronum]|uniref:Cobalt/nickel transport system permease protein n=1 Tax=Desulfomicrobium apsheronum TaxID=52560 RepID=A0A1I3MVE9_9BACT|nr:cobalt ECF transporter T component CbiQ [Desulfomicrobium apsheronum]SFJ00745.1 cobalt/nickel transport system permease protein [Desulfomicrobium apsheronum]